MGNVSSNPAGQVELTGDDLAELMQATPLSQKELRKLYKRFRALDRNELGFIQRADIVNIPEFVMNPLSERILAVLDPQNKDQINFFEFAKRLSVFSKRAPVEDKIRFDFEIYDVDRDGFVTMEEVRQVLRMMVGSTMSDQVLTAVALKAHQAVGRGKEKLTFEDFLANYKDSALPGTLCVEFTKPS